MYLYVELRGNQFHAMPEEYPLVIHEIAFFSQEGKFRLDRRQSSYLLHIPYPILLGYFFFIRKFCLLYYYYPRLRIEGGVEYLVKHHFINKPLTHKKTRLTHPQSPV